MQYFKVEHSNRTVRSSKQGQLLKKFFKMNAAKSNEWLYLRAASKGQIEPRLILAERKMSHSEPK